MSPLHAIWLASLVGAGLFFLAGYLIRKPQPVAGVLGASPRQEPPEAMEERQRELAALRQQAAQGERRAAELEVQLERRVAQQGDLERLAGERPQLARRVAELESQLERSVAQQGELERRTGERAPLERRIAELEREVRAQQKLAAQADADRSRAESRSESGAAEARRAVEDLAKLTRAKDLAEQAARAREQEVAALRRDRVEIEAQLAQAREAMERATRKQAATESEAQRSRDQIADLQRTVASLEKRVASTELERAGLANDVAAQTRLVSELKAAADQHADLVMRVEALKGKEQEAEALREERRLLLERVGDAEREAHDRPDPKTLADLQHDIMVQGEVARSRVEELERVRTENAALKVSLAELGEALRARDAELTREVEALRARDLAARPSPPKAGAPAPGPIDGRPLQALVEQLAGRSQAVVITDPLGLVVAGHGDLAEPLGAFAAVIAGEGQRARNFLPVGAMKRISLRDERGMTITTHLMSAPQSELVVAILELDELEDETPELRQLARTVSSLSL